MTQNDIDKLRATNRVVPVSKEDEGLSWSKISNSVYGFSYSPGHSDGGLFLKQPRQCYEMHKLGDASLHIVAFTTPQYAEKLQAKGAQELELYPEARDEYQVVVMVPHDRIATAKELDRDDFNKLKLSLRPIS